VRGGCAWAGAFAGTGGAFGGRGAGGEGRGGSSRQVSKARGEGSRAGGGAGGGGVCGGAGGDVVVGGVQGAWGEGGGRHARPWLTSGAGGWGSVPRPESQVPVSAWGCALSPIRMFQAPVFEFGSG